MPIPPLTEPFPSRDRIVKSDGKASDVFIRWNEETLIARLAATPVLPGPVEVLDDRNTSLSGTIGSTQSAGLYAVDYYLQVLTVAGVASGIQLAISWTFNGVVQTETFANLNTNLITSHQGARYPIRVDGNTTVTYTLTYASNPAGAMRYSASLALVLLQAIEE